MNDMIFDKPFKTYEAQISILESRNIVIRNHQFALRVLSSLSYYTIINGYKNTFISIPGTDNFVDGTNFEDLYTLHLIDTNLNTIVLKYILFTERYLKTRLSYLISRKYGVYTDLSDPSNNNEDDYLCRNHYSRSSRQRNNILRRIKTDLHSVKINESVRHYIDNKNHLPPWILVTNMSFGATIKWYSILSSDDKNEICNKFLPDTSMPDMDKKEFLTVSLDLLKEYRNRIAHSNRAFNVPGLPVLPKRQLLSLSCGTLSSKEYNANIGKSDLFGVILTCFILIDDQYLLTNFINDLSYVLNPYSDISLNNKSVYEIFGLPDDLLNRLERILLNKVIEDESFLLTQ